KLALMADRQRPHGALLLDQRTQRHLSPAAGGYVDQIERIGIDLELRIDLQDHPITGLLGEKLRDLALSERIAERVVDRWCGDAEPGCRVAIDLEPQGWPRDLLV